MIINPAATEGTGLLDLHECPAIDEDGFAGDVGDISLRSCAHLKAHPARPGQLRKEYSPGNFHKR